MRKKREVSGGSDALNVCSVKRWFSARKRFAVCSVSPRRGVGRWKTRVSSLEWMMRACTHGPGSLSEGYIDGDVVECNFHNGQFNIKTGEVVAPPCMIPIKTYKAVVENGRVLIEAE